MLTLHYKLTRKLMNQGYMSKRGLINKEQSDLGMI